MRKRVKNSFVLLCGVVSLVAGVLSILANLGYLRSLKHALRLP
jgi:hypothetical protein